MHPDTAHPLTTAERTQLRPTIDQAALERFLAAAPAGFRRFFILACSRSLTEAEFDELGLPRRLPPERLHRALAGLLTSEELERLWDEVEVFGARGA